MKTTLDDLIIDMQSLAHTNEDREWITTVLKALDAKYGLARKIGESPEVAEIIRELVERIYRAYGVFDRLKGKRILDIASGSNTSKAPSPELMSPPAGEQPLPISGPEGYSALFEPWFCRILLELGADPVGVDRGSLDDEGFEHYQVDLGQPGALSFLPDRSFDGVQDSRLFGSPEFTAQFPQRADRLKVAAEIVRQEQRLLKASGVVIHSDAAELLQ